VLFVFLPVPTDAPDLHSSPTRRSSDLLLVACCAAATACSSAAASAERAAAASGSAEHAPRETQAVDLTRARQMLAELPVRVEDRSEEHTSELQSRENLVCRLLLEKKNR